MGHRAPVNGIKVTMITRRFRAISTPERALPGSCKARARIAEALRQRSWRMSLCRYLRSDCVTRGAKAAALILFGTSGSSGVFAFETAKAFAGNRVPAALAGKHPKKSVRTNDASN
jgi:hypothetical protein